MGGRESAGSSLRIDIILDLFGGAGGRGTCWDEALAGTELGRATSMGGDAANCGRATAGDRTSPVP